MLQIRLLGRFSVEDDGKPIALPPATLPLLAYLVLHRGAGPIARATVAFRLWPDATEGDAMVRLRRNLFRLTTALPTSPIPWILADGRSLRWNDDAAAWFDVDHLPDVRDVDASMASIELLPEHDHEWLVPLRAEVRERSLAALWRAVAAHRRDADVDAALATAHRLLNQEPLREDAARAIIEMRAEAGDRAGAIAFYERFARRLDDELGVRPATETAELARRIMDQADRRRINVPLPIAPDAFIGRSKDVATLTERLRTSATRIVTVTGIGGVGKTRLAMAAAEACAAEFPDGTAFIEFADSDQNADVSSRVASMLGATDATAAIGTLRALVILDNCEHVIDGVAELAATLVRSCPSLTILATSREPLHVRGESLHRLAALPLPPRSEEGPGARDYAAVQLLLERSAAAGQSTAAVSWPTIARISRKLQGLPLAIELAAARTSVLSFDELEGALDDDPIGVCSGGGRDVTARRRSLRASYDWTFDRLSARERTALFEVDGDCVAKVAAMSDVLSALIDKALITVAREAGTHYAMAPFMRPYLAARGA